MNKLLLNTIGLALAPATSLMAQPQILETSKGQTTILGQPLHVLLLLTALTLLPAIFVPATPFLRIAGLLPFLRQAVRTRKGSAPVRRDRQSAGAQKPEGLGIDGHPARLHPEGVEGRISNRGRP